MNARFLTLSVLLLASPSLAQSAEAKRLNSAAMDAYKAKNWQEAISQFQQAIKADPGFALPHYNLACTLALVRRAGQVCSFDAYRHVIVNELRQSVKLDPRRKDRMKRDPDLEAVRDTIGYQQLIGVSPATKDGLLTLLQNVSWWDKGQGAYGSLHSLKLLPGGKVTFTEKELTDDGEVKTNSYTGSWALEQAKSAKGWKVRLKLPAVGKQPARSMLGQFTGTALEFKDDGLTFFDEPDECSA